MRLSRSGDDILGEGLYEYMFDVIYVTWLCDVLMVVFGSYKAWFLFMAVPGYFIYKAALLALLLKGHSNATNATDQSSKRGLKKKRK